MDRNKKNYQPVSRILFPPHGRRSSFIWPLHCCRDLAAYPPASDEPSSIAGIRGISACKVYPSRQLLTGAVGSYPTFSTSPLPFLPFGEKKEAVIFCGTIYWRLTATRLLTGALPYAVRTFLPLHKQRAMTRLVAGKGTENYFLYPPTRIGYFIKKLSWLSYQNYYICERTML